MSDENQRIIKALMSDKAKMRATLAEAYPYAPKPHPVGKYEQFPTSENVDDRRGESFPLAEVVTKNFTGMPLDYWKQAIKHPFTPVKDKWPPDD